MSLIPIGTVIELDFRVHDTSVSPAVLADADSTPTYSVIEAAGSAIISASSVTRRSTGKYYVRFTVTASGPTFVPGKIYQVTTAATVGGALDEAILCRFLCGPATSINGVPKVDVRGVNGATLQGDGSGTPWGPA